MIRKLFFLWGAAPDGEEGGEGGEVEGGKPIEEAPPSKRELTDEEMSKMTAQAADKASRKTRRDIASDMGFDSMKDLQEFVGSKKEADDAALDEQTKALQDAERTKKEYEAQLSDLSGQRLTLDISQAVISSGVVDKAKAKRVAALVRDDLDPESIEDEGSWEAAITVALQSVKDDMPELFVASGSGSGDGGAHGDAPTLTDEEKEAARQKQLKDEYEKQGLIYHPFPN